MARKASKWKHKKYKREYVGTYGYNPKTGRVFCLIPVGGTLTQSKKGALAFESHEAAKAAGWKKL